MFTSVSDQVCLFFYPAQCQGYTEMDKLGLYLNKKSVCPFLDTPSCSKSDQAEAQSGVQSGMESGMEPGTPDSRPIALSQNQSKSNYKPTSQICSEYM